MGEKGLYGGVDFRGDEKEEKVSDEITKFYNRGGLDIGKDKLSYAELEALWEQLDLLKITPESALLAVQVLYNLILMAFWKHDNEAVEYYRKKFNQIGLQFKYGESEVGNEYFTLNNVLERRMEMMSEEEEYVKDNQEKIGNLLNVTGRGGEEEKEEKEEKEEEEEEEEKRGRGGSYKL